MKKLTMLSIAVLMALMTVTAALAGGAGASSPETVPVSLGLRVIAEQCAMSKYGVSGSEIAFSPEDFERALNSKRVDYLTVTSLPTENVGTLYLGGEAVSEGQTVSRENIHKLSYVPEGEGISEDSFVFSTGRGYEIECGLYMLDSENYAPTAGVSGELSLTVSTHRNVSVWGDLSGHDSDGDEIRFEIVSYPVNGLVVLTDEKSGEFRYTPKAEYTGKDSFKYVVIDKYGNYSAASEVSLTVSRVGIEEVLSDMGGNRAHTDAITMVENGLMTATRGSSGRLEFRPNEAVSREDFLVMTMKAAGIKPDGAAPIEFADGDDISAAAKGYVALALSKGYISGTQVGDDRYFYPQKTVTAAEAAVMIDNIIGGEQYVVNGNGALSVFADEDEIPAWAEESVLTLTRVGVISGRDGYLYPQKELTRESAAMMLSAVMELTDREIK